MSNETALRDAPVQTPLSCSKSEQTINFMLTSILLDLLNVVDSFQFAPFLTSPHYTYRDMDERGGYKVKGFN